MTLMTYLCFGQAQDGGDFKALWPRQILVEFELTLEFEQLLTRERRAWSARFAHAVLEVY